MKSRKAKSFIIIAVILSVTLLLFPAISILLNTAVPREIIKSYVENNIDALNEIVRSPLPDQKDIRKMIFKELNPYVVRDIYQYDDSIVSFGCGGTGLSTNSTYVGFYYSPTDTPYAMEFHGTAEFEETSPGVFYWESEDTCLAFYTERIIENWFYYDMKWY